MSYVPIFILMIIALSIGGSILILSSLLGGGEENKRKNMPFECGVPQFGSPKQRFSIRFYLIAILFLLFDVEGIFFFPWALVYQKFLSINRSFVLLEMLFFSSVLFIGYLYVVRKDALEWE